MTPQHALQLRKDRLGIGVGASVIGHHKNFEIFKISVLGRRPSTQIRRHYRNLPAANLGGFELDVPHGAIGLADFQIRNKAPFFEGRRMAEGVGIDE